jgi:hypothetical protein
MYRMGTRITSTDDLIGKASRGEPRAPEREGKATIDWIVPGKECFDYFCDFDASLAAVSPPRLTWSTFQNAVDARPANAEPPSNLDRAHAIGLQRFDLSRPRSRRRLPASISSFLLCPRDPFALPLKHHFALECRYRADHREQKLAGRRASVDAEIEYTQVGPP